MKNSNGRVPTGEVRTLIIFTVLDVLVTIIKYSSHESSSIAEVCYWLFSLITLPVMGISLIKIIHHYLEQEIQTNLNHR